jgi:glycogen debranching enzyme
MDAKIGDWVVTPRQGKAVEIQALWYNALRVMEDLASRFGDADGQHRFAALAERARDVFRRQFWNSSAECLYDVIDEESKDGSLRPNQILAVSLPYSMLDREQGTSVVNAVKRELLTPVGLRTLPINDSRYVSHYEGGVQSRDSSYHQGTVWPWLMGPFVTAYLKVNDFSLASRQQAQEWLKPFASHLFEAGLGHVSEICDAAAPHTPRGCFAQAWSVGELLRVALLLRQQPEQSATKSRKSGKSRSRTMVGTL